MAQKRHLATDSSTSSPSVTATDDGVYEDSEDESEMTVRTKAARYIRRGLYFVTDSEKFRPPRKRPKYFVSSFLYTVPLVGCGSSVNLNRYNLFCFQHEIFFFILKRSKVDC